MNVTSVEIDSQPDVWRTAWELRDEAARVLARPGERMLVIGCGTSAFVAESFALLREEAGLGETDAAYASEPRPWRPYDVVVSITRSGTTTEIIEAMNAVPAGVRKVVITGVADSPCAQLADDVLLLDFADEKSVVQTRFPTTLLFLARAAFGEDVSGLPDDAAAALADPPAVPDEFDHVVYLGRGWTYGLAQEAALKIREAAQAWAESYPLLDYRHGPLAVAHEGSLVWFLGARNDGLAGEIEATGATVVQGTADPLIELALAQRLAVRTAEQRGLDPDNPRHLTRSIVLS
ncbi:SIS domain-containing protein [Microbacterium aerolatum]|uniref:Glucosamine--fructose-6-phosphate aminotransferase n=1 Tax=Microbacterium aerolatum TaxID=153731 RepID=A0A511AM41_9MICO|nr:SIS domain-containing protein [Microbacterium aerolatum]GEK87941.1 glucosamine--fructose-6-phosphate aminotransferase [Microbacterium aerolatum]GGB32164.1 glucosamine--fructose-6-phosphate aminotransferase [Microbacterium aerolatum]